MLIHRHCTDCNLFRIGRGSFCYVYNMGRRDHAAHRQNIRRSSHCHVDAGQVGRSSRISRALEGRRTDVCTSLPRRCQSCCCHPRNKGGHQHAAVAAVSLGFRFCCGRFLLFSLVIVIVVLATGFFVVVTRHEMQNQFELFSLSRFTGPHVVMIHSIVMVVLCDALHCPCNCSEES